MTILQTVLLIAASIMFTREVIKSLMIAAATANRGSGSFGRAYWIHLWSTVALVLAFILSLTGVDS